MAICGFGNLYLDCMMSPQLTSVDQMAFHGCKMGLSILLDKLTTSSTQTQTEPVFLEYEPKLHIRNSTLKQELKKLDLET